MKKTLFGVLALFLLVVMGLGIWGAVYNIRFVVPQETISQGFWIPVNPDIRSSETVHPETFKFFIPLEELQTTTEPGKQVVVVYQILYNIASVEYFRSRADGAWDYTQIVMPKPPSKTGLDSLLTKWDVAFDNENRTFQYTLIKQQGLLYRGIILIAIAGFILCASWSIATYN